MTVATKILMGSGAVAEPFEIEQSLIFNGGNSYLSKTFGSAGNRDRWTFSCWIKRSKLSVSAGTAIFAAYDNASNRDVLRFDVTDEIELQVVSGGTGYSKKSVAKYRDPSAWYHIVAVYDSANATADYRIRLYVNGSEITSSTGTDPSSGLDSTINNSDIHYVGARSSSGSVQAFWGGYIAELNFIDGSALTPSSFGRTNSATGQWIPKEYGGSYGSNGFYLKMASGALGTDSSGNSNTYSATNLANADVVPDSPTNNFATLNPAVALTSGMVLSEGNLDGNFRAGNITNGSQAVSTIAMPVGSGKWYWEMRQPYTGQGFLIGISPDGELPRLGFSGNLGYNQYNGDGGKQQFQESRTSYGTAWFTSGQTYIISCYYDSDLGKIGFYMNGADQGFAFTNVVAKSYVPTFANASGGTASFPTVINFGQNGTFNGAVTAQGNADANGIGDFYYAPPSGYKALCTANLPDPAIPLPSAQFNSVVYAGAGQTQTVTGVGFQPDFVWIKNRSATSYHNLMDAVRGIGSTTYAWFTNATDAEASLGSGTNKVSAVNSNGFVIDGNSNDLNNSSENYVAWNWKANGAGSTNNDGATATVSANQAAGFSIVKYANPSGSDVAIGHGLGVKPELWIVKNLEDTGDNFVYTTAIDGGGDYLKLNATDAANAWSGTVPTTSLWYETFSGGTGEDFICYLFASKEGFSKIGVYTGNGNADGPFISTGFKPAWVMIKLTSASGLNWNIFDNKRDPLNVASKILAANTNAADVDAASVDILSNGFKIRASGSYANSNNATYLYMAFAESPFKTATAR